MSYTYQAVEYYVNEQLKVSFKLILSNPFGYNWQLCNKIDTANSQTFLKHQCYTLFSVFQMFTIYHKVKIELNLWLRPPLLSDQFSKIPKVSK